MKILIAALLLSLSACKSEKRTYHVNCEGEYFKGTAIYASSSEHGTFIKTGHHVYDYPPSVKCEIVVTEGR